MERVTRMAPAKLNLRLLVGPRRRDGYHDIRTLMVVLDGFADEIELARADRRAIDCPGVNPENNLITHALDMLEAETGHLLPCHVRVDKRIPVEAGLGGGSSDAAAALVGANELFDLGLDAPELERIGASIGSDVPFFVRGGCQWAEGHGERLTPTDAPFGHALVVPSPKGLPTPAVYRRFDELPPPPPDDGVAAPPGMPQLAGWVRNDLWNAARDLQPSLELAARELSLLGADAVLLCGSGSAMAGLFTAAPPEQPGAIVASFGG